MRANEVVYFGWAWKSQKIMRGIFSVPAIEHFDSLCSVRVSLPMRCYSHELQLATFGCGGRPRTLSYLECFPLARNSLGSAAYWYFEAGKKTSSKNLCKPPQAVCSGRSRFGFSLNKNGFERKQVEGK